MILAHLFYGITNIIHRKRTNKIYLSFGENCLTDNILSRYCLKSFTTPFSHCRSNVEYILDLERNNFENFLSDEFLAYGDLNGKPVPRLNTHLVINNNYHHLHKNGIEFPNHDIIRKQQQRQKVVERANKLKSFLGKREYVILYHHRTCSNSDLELLLQHLLELKKYYTIQECECQVVLFKQIIITNESKKKMIYQKKNDIHVFDFHTHTAWGGRNPMNYWAFIDEPLIRKMLNIVKAL